MKEFITGKSYIVNDKEKSIVTVVKRTNHYITIEGGYKGRYYVYRQDLFRLGENIYIKHPVLKNTLLFCFAGHEK